MLDDWRIFFNEVHIYLRLSLCWNAHYAQAIV